MKRKILQFRVSETEYQEIVEAAKAHQLTISQEAARRLRKYPLLSASELKQLAIRAAKRETD